MYKRPLPAGKKEEITQIQKEMGQWLVIAGMHKLEFVQGNLKRLPPGFLHRSWTIVTSNNVRDKVKFVSYKAK